MAVVVDTTGDRFRSEGSPSRRRFFERTKEYRQKAFDRAINGRSIKDFDKDGVDVTVPKRGLSRPQIGHGRGGIWDQVFPGNDQFSAGDKIKRPQGGGGGSGAGEASQDGEHEDEFTFNMSRDEFLEWFFKDLGLPNLKKKGMVDARKTQLKRAGISSSGPEDRRNLPRTWKKRLERTTPALAPYNRKLIVLLEEKKAILSCRDPEGGVLPAGFRVRKADDFVSLSDQVKDLVRDIAVLHDRAKDYLSEDDVCRIAEIDEKIEGIRNQMASQVPGIDPQYDSKFNALARVPVKISQAVMFCVMDVSGSMDEERKANAKRLFILLSLFLEREYENVEFVFIRHHTTAKEVDEDEFFNSKESGGTVVSTALQKIIEIREARYPADKWNTYALQASDGDNWDNDNMTCDSLLRNKILPDIEGFIYAEITDGDRQNLWRTYEKLRDAFPDRFRMGHVESTEDVGRVFRELFKKQEGAPVSRLDVSPAP